jgi:hypothetical protein
MCSIIKIIALFIVLGIGAFVYFYWGAKNLEDYCVNISIGSPVSEIEKSITTNGFKSFSFRRDHANFLVIYDHSTMGRFICQVRYDNSTVTSREYVYND